METLRICRVDELPESVRLIIEAQKKLKEENVVVDLEEKDKKTPDPMES